MPAVSLEDTPRAPKLRVVISVQVGTWAGGDCGERPLQWVGPKRGWWQIRHTDNLSAEFIEKRVEGRGGERGGGKGQLASSEEQLGKTNQEWVRTCLLKEPYAPAYRLGPWLATG